ncbi:UNVERIFIED_CONTAM: hypothetical protein FKN15_003100 [Acipenser sinensis]
MSGVVRTLSRCLIPAEASRERSNSKERSRDRDVNQEREARRRSREIDSMLARERRSIRRLVKILLLGAGESGKIIIIVVPASRLTLLYILTLACDHRSCIVEENLQNLGEQWSRLIRISVC